MTKHKSIRNGKFSWYVSNRERELGQRLVCADELADALGGVSKSAVPNIIIRYKSQGKDSVPTRVDNGGYAGVPALYYDDDKMKAFLAARVEEMDKRKVRLSDKAQPPAPAEPPVDITVLERIAVALERLAGAWEQR